MPDITISLNDLLSDDQCREIERQLNGLAKEPLKAFCRAAIAEFADAIFTRRQESASLTPQHRLYRLIRHAFDGTIPSETFVSAFFGIPDRKAFTMISNVTKRYGAEFDKGWVVAITAAFATKEAVKSNDRDAYRFHAPQTVMNHLKEVVADLSDGRLAPVVPVRGTAERYEISKDTYDAVCTKLSIPGDPKP